MKSEEQMQGWVTAQALEWFVAHRSNELTGAKREEFIDWLRASPAHVREYLALTGFSEDLRQVVANLPVSAESLLEQARADLTTVQPLFPALDRASAGCESGMPVPAEKSLRNWLVAAAVIFGAVALGFFTMWRLQAPPDYSTAHAEQRSWRMPDGSTVHLNSGTQIKVRFSEQRREVELLQGQALFQVAKDAQRPFWVRTGDAAVKAVGTEFDVYRQPQRTIVSVVEGRVAVWRLQGKSNQAARALGGARESTVSGEPVAQVDAGQQARISGATAVVSKKADEVRKTVAWLQRQVVFDHDPLGTAVEEFNRYSDLSIRIADPALSTAEVSGIFSAYDAEAFIRFLEHQPDMQVERTDREVIVSTKVAL